MGQIKNKSKLLIIGGSGFIGKNLTRKALNEGFQVTILSINEIPKEEVIDEVDYLRANILETKFDVENKIKDFEYVVNLSGYVNHSSFLIEGDEVIDVHFGGLRNILKVLQWGKLKRFVQIGSSDEYGNQPAPQKEHYKEDPISPYALAKTASSYLLQMLARTEKFPAVILRLFLVYGPEQKHDRFMPQIINGCLSNKDFATSYGEQYRDFCYIDDVSDAILKSLKAENVVGEIINIASGNRILIREVIEKISSFIGKGNPRFGEIGYRAGENLELYADISKAKKLLNWTPSTSIDEGIVKTIKYFHDKL